MAHHSWVQRATLSCTETASREAGNVQTSNGGNSETIKDNSHYGNSSQNIEEPHNINVKYKTPSIVENRSKRKRIRRKNNTKKYIV